MPRRNRTEELIEHRAFLCRLARSLLGDEAQAEDVVHDAFVAALAQPPRAESGMRPWLTRVVRHRSFNAKRDRRRRTERERAEARPEALPSHEEVVERLEISRRLVEAVQGLRESYRSAIYRRFFEGLSVDAIAREEGVPRDTVKTRLRRALAELRAVLDRGHDDRRAWTLALAPLSRLAPTEPAVATGGGLHSITAFAGILWGVLVMKKLLVGIVLVIALVGGLWLVNEVEIGAPAAETEAAAPAGTLVAPEETEVLTAPAADESARQTVVVPQEDVAAPTTREAGPLTVEVVWETTGEPAAGIEVLTKRGGRGLGSHPNDQRATTKEDGRVRFEGLPLGLVVVHGFRGGWAEVEILLGEEVSAKLTIPRGVDVQGVVVDVEGRPVAGAEVWIRQETYGWMAGRVATTTDSTGRFALRSVDPARGIAARAAGHAPSLVEELSTRRSAPGTPVELTLALRGKGGAVEGRVMTPEGDPVADAVVVIGPHRRSTLREDGSRALLAPPLVARTDEDGTFSFSGVDAGRIPIDVVAKGFCRQSGYDFEVRAGETAHRTIRLRQGMSVEGTVVDADGSPARGARIRRYYPGRSVLRPLPLPGTTTDEEGRYRLDDLVPGKVHLLAWREPMHAETELEGASGDTLVWNATLATLDPIRGRVVAADGNPLANWTVAAYTGSPSSVRTHDKSDETGSFSLHAPPPGPYLVGAARELVPFVDCVAWVSEIEAGDTDIVLVIDQTRPAFLVGRIEDAAGRIGDQERVTVRAISVLDAGPEQEVEAGTFRVGPLAPGTWFLRVAAGTTTILCTGPYALAAGEERDVGVLHTEVPGRVVVELDLSPDLVVGRERLSCTIVNFENLAFQALVPDGDGFVGAEVAPGTYFLNVAEDGVFLPQVRFEVRSGEEMIVRARLEPGAIHTFSVRLPEEEGGKVGLRIALRDMKGVLLRETRIPPCDIEELPLAASFPRGTSQLTLTTDSGLTATVEVVVNDIDDPSELFGSTPIELK